METPRYPIGIQSFEEIRSGGYVYVDKTEFVYRLAKEGKYYFLSRPRRFGKSLFLSTMEAYYRGRRDLFKGLALDRLTEEWEPHPVFHLDLNNRNYKDEDSLQAELNANLERWENLYGNEKKDRAVEERFAYVIEQAFIKTGRKVVILIDEYDKPLLNTIDNPELSDKYRASLKAFFGNLKTKDQYIEIAMITGVARFSKVSIFSDLNNLRDISFSMMYSHICGITATEFNRMFQPGIESMARRYKISCEEMADKLRQNYDGYHFSEESEDIYNPFSLMYAFADNSIGSYWFGSGTPTFLVRKLLRGKWDLRRLSGYKIKKSTLEQAGINSDDPVPIFYQSGYLTIKGYVERFNQYILDYPNKEVKEGFLDFLLPYYIKGSESSTEFDISEFVEDVYEGNAENFMKRLDSLIAKVPYSEKGTPPESHFQNAIYLIFTLMGFYVRMEERVSDGRIDLTVETEGKIYLFEFKIDSTAETAMKQIHAKEYWKPYRASGKDIILIGANFDTSTRRLDGILIEKP